MNTNLQYERYQRQIQLKEFGEIGQQKLLAAKVLVIGAGGLGCPALQYLAAAGVGTIGIVDDDIVALHNLHRQILFTTNDIGLNKAIVAKEKLTQLNSEIKINVYTERLTVANALKIMDVYDIILDGTDNFVTRYMINDACVLLNKPFVFGAISKFEGQVAIFNFNNYAFEIATNYRDLFPQPPKDGEVLNCAETGVIGVLPGIIGTMMANETIKLLTSMGNPLINKMYTYNALTNQTYTLDITPNKEAALLIPSTKFLFQQMNYEWLCSSSIGKEFEIDALQFDEYTNLENNVIIDVRELNEQPLVTEFTHLSIPLSQLKNRIDEINAEKIIIFCQSGKRSLQAAQILLEKFGSLKKIFSLQGGIVSWKKIKETQLL
jgi:sulfur-carrier protein adenylyltransferase/sulfurtransferase